VAKVAVGIETLEYLGLGVGDRMFGAQILDMRRSDRGDDRDMRADLAGERGDLRVPADVLERRVEVFDLVERADLGLVGEQHVDLVLDELQELVAVAVDAGPVREREGHAPS